MANLSSTHKTKLVTKETEDQTGGTAYHAHGLEEYY